MANQKSVRLKRILIAVLIFSGCVLVYFSYSNALSAYPTTISNDLEFDGKSGQLMLNASFAAQRVQANGVTFAVWAMMYPQAKQGQNPILGVKEYQFYLDGESSGGTKFTWIVWNSSGVGTYLISKVPFTFFRWYFLTASWDPATGIVSLYVDGSLTAQGNGPTSISWKSDQWLVGRNDNNYTLYGRVANLQAYTGTLSADEISALYGMGREGSFLTNRNVLGWWRLSGDLLGYDKSSNFQSNGGVEWIKSKLLAFPFDILSVVATYATVSSTLSLLPWAPRIRQLHFIAPLLRKYELYVVAIFLKTFIALMTPLSLDFLNILHTASFSSWPYGVSPQEGGFWFLVVHAFSAIWNIIPVSHPSVQVAFRSPFDIYFNQVAPPPGGAFLAGFFFNDGASGLFAWVLMAKVPNIMLDVVIGLVIYQIMLKTVNDPTVAISSMLLWLFNPVSFILIEMWSSNDAPMVLFLLCSVYCLMSGKKILSAIFYGLAISVRLAPIILLPVMIFALTKHESKPKPESSPSLHGAQNYLSPLRMLAVVAAASVGPNLPLLFVTNLPFLSNPVQAPSSILLSSSYQFAFGITFGGTAANLYGFRFGIAIMLLSIFSLFVVKEWRKRNDVILDNFILLFSAIFVLSQWNPQYWLWILPFLVMKVGYNKSYRGLVSLQFLLFMLINFTLVGYYYSSLDRSVFFFPNYTPTLQRVSDVLYGIFNDPTFIGLRLDELLISTFAGVNIWLILRLLWARISEHVAQAFHVSPS